MPASGVGLGQELDVKFHSAVNLIRSLPKDGSFQPSYDDASKVYGYYKQVQLGPCNQPKPGFWDVIGKAKWNAWSQLGDMPKDEAMENYVVEIKKLFERLTSSDAYLEEQKKISDTIVPFCTATGMELPAAIENEIARKKKAAMKKKAAKKKNADKEHNTNGHSNGHSNGHQGSSQASKNELMEVRINGDHVEVRQNGIEKEVEAEPPKRPSITNESQVLEKDIDKNITAEHEKENGTSLEEEESLNLTETVNAKDNGSRDQAFGSIKSIFEDTDSSDADDVYCDSFNPDNVPRFAGSNGDNAEQEVEDISDNELTRVTDNTSLLNTETPSLIAQNGEDFHVHSTPAVKVKWQVVYDENGDGYCRNSENSTDVSTLSSNSAENNATVPHSPNRSDREMEEDELSREFGMKNSRHERKKKSQYSRKSHSGSEKVDDMSIQHHHDVYKERQMVVSARGGSSQTDLAASGANADARGRETPRQAEAQVTAPEVKERSTRPRRTHKESSSDSTASSSGSERRGETIGEQIVRTLERLEKDMQMVLLRLNSIETEIKSANQLNRRPWWTIYIPSKRVMMLLLWPVIINILFAYWRRRRRK